MANKVALGVLNTLGSTGTRNASNALVRTSTGVLYAIAANGLNGGLRLFRSADNGLTWALQDSGNAPSTAAANNGRSFACAIDGADNIHIAFNGLSASSQSYVKFTTSTNTYGSVEKIAALSTSLSISIAVDSNNIPHVVVASSGNFPLYTNRLSGSFRATTQVEATTGPQYIELLIDQNNVPQIVGLTSTGIVLGYLGNKNNATSFTRTAISTAASNFNGIAASIDVVGNTWIAYQTVNNGPIQLVKHIQTNSWATWQIALTDGFAGFSPSLASDQNDIYIFYERNAGGLAYDRYDTLNGKWLGEQVVQANALKSGTNLQFHNPFVKWSQYFNNGDTGANNSGQQTIEYLFDDGSTVYYDKLTTAQISTGLAQITFGAPGASTTTSTSSTSSSSTSSSTSTTVSTSTSSTSSSVSTSTSSTSSSTSRSTSTSSTSQSTSTSFSTSSTSQSTSISTSSTSQSTSTSSTSSSTSFSTSSTSSSISTSSTSASTSASTSTSSTSSSTSTTVSFTTSTSSTSSSISTSSTSQSTSTSLSTSTSSTSSSISTSSTSTSVSFTTSTSSTSASTSTSSTSNSTSISTSSTSTSASTSTSSTSRSTSTSSTSSSISTSTSSTSQSTSFSTSSTSRSTSTSSTSQSTSLSTSISSTSSSTSTTISTTTSTSSTSTSVSTTSTSTSTTTIAGTDVNMFPRAIIRPYRIWTKVRQPRVIIR